MSDPQKQLQKVKSAIAKARAEIGDYRKYVDGMEQQLVDSFAEATRSFGVMLDNELLYDFISEFKKQPFFTIPKSKGEWWLVVPKNVPLEFGFLYAQDGPWNIFIVSKYANLIQDIPEALQEELEFDLTPPFDGITVDEDTGFLHIDRPDHDDVKEVRSRYKKYLGAIKDSSTIRIKKGMLFEMMAALIRDGILPYKARPVPKSLFRDRYPKFELRDYQQRDWEIFLKTGAVGLFYPMAGGKSFLALMAIQRFKGKKLILVPNGTVAENWKEYILQWTDIPPEQVSTERVDVGKVEVSVIIYNRANVDAVLKVEWSFVDFDETTTVVADTHIAFANVKATTRIFMTATPMREDGREDLIFALSGRPLGVDWQYFLENNIVRRPQIHLWVERDQSAKLSRLDSLIDPSRRTIIFCDGIKLGNAVAKKYDIPFVSGKTRKSERLDTIRNNKHVIVSRVGDLGISIKDIDVVIEIDYNAGSRQQETQRVGRTFHSEEEGTYHALLTASDYVAHRKRFTGIYAKRLKIIMHMSEDLPDDLVAYVTRARVTGRARRERRAEPRMAEPVSVVDTTKYAMLDERNDLNGNMVLTMLRSPLAKERGGLIVEEIQDNLKFCHIRGAGTRKARRMVYKMYKDKEIGARRDEKGKRRYFVTDS